uniref:recombinase family protein n=1 Tax=Mesomycoplasma ovipneumoniae TaxID=29562 RepID=UPI003CCA4D65
MRKPCRKKEHDANEIRRAALYIRVSTDEQARKGYSLPAQQEALEEYAKKNNYIVSGMYIDDGVSAHLKYTKRPALM